MLDDKDDIVSYLSWESLFLGFHNMELYIHNDEQKLNGMRKSL
jgi:hypothetical protein